MSKLFQTSQNALALSAALLSLAGLAALSPAMADVFMTQTTSSSGIMGMGAVEGTSTIVLSGGNQRTDSQMSVQGMPGGMGGAHNSIDIIRMDKGVMWNINETQSQYTETSFAQMKEMMASGFGAAGKSEGKESGGKKMDLAFSIEETGAEKEINGFATRQSILKIEAQSNNREGRGDFTIVADLWIAKEVPGQEELTAFQKQFASKLGMDPKLMQGAGGMGSFLAAGMGKMSDELSKLDGYPILSIITLETSQIVGGFAGESGGMPDMASIDMEKIKKAAAAAQSGDMETAKRLMAEMEKSQKQAQAGGTTGGAPQSMTLVIKSEVTEIRTNDVPQVDFDVPEGFKKVERQMPFQMGGDG